MSEPTLKSERAGAIGAVLDETERAAIDFCRVVESLTADEYQQAWGTDHPQLHSVQGVAVHCVNWTYAYSNFVRQARGRDVDAEAGIGADAMARPGDVRPAIDAAIAHTEESVDGLLTSSIADLVALSFDVPWGPRFTPETMLEHGLVHYLRHRRQIERWMATR